MDLRALVVSPDQDSTGLLTLILSELGMAAEHTPSISRGLELLDSERFDAIILDYRADQSSEEFLSHLRRSAKNRASMLIAVVDSEFNARPVFGLGANFVLYRPLSSERTRISLRAARGLMRRERRRAPRTPLSSTANVAYPGAPELDAVLTDLSDGGTSLQTANRIPPACKVYFEFALPGQMQLVRLSGEVAWQDASGRTGIRFLDVPQSSRRLMQAWMQQNNANPATGLPAQSSVSKSSAPQSLAPQSGPVASRGPRHKIRASSPMPAIAAENNVSPANWERKFTVSAVTFPIAAPSPISARAAATLKCQLHFPRGRGWRFWCAPPTRNSESGAKYWPSILVLAWACASSSTIPPSAKKFCACSQCSPPVRRWTNNPAKPAVLFPPRPGENIPTKV